MGTNGDDTSDFNDLVVVGSSAGGVEALAVLVSTLPSDFPAPIVLAQHLDPNRPSMLGATLERKSTLPVVVVDKVCRLHRGTVYVVPSNQHVTISDGEVRLEGDHRGRPRPSVDLLFTSAASVYGDRLLAVILTGSGSDGAAGAIEVKKKGGTVVVQNPATAKYSSMPSSLPPTAVDYVADLDQIGALLTDILSGAMLPAEQLAGEDDVAEILSIVSRYSEIDFHQYKPATITRRIGRRMAVTHCASLREYAEFLAVNAGEAAELTMAFLIDVTEFFRDNEAFEFIRAAVLPNLINQGRANGRVLRFWSAGCATGEEPYSLALLVAEALGAELAEWSVKIFATDIDERAIEYARRGVYSAAALENVPTEMKSRYFDSTEFGYRLSKSVRQMVIFGHQDLSRAVPFPRIDFVVCRNLLIYFKPEIQQQILDSFAYSLTRNGYLFLGKAETARPSKAVFELSDRRWKVFRCLNCPIGLIPIHGSRSAPEHDARAGGSAHEPAERNVTPDPVPEGEIGHLRRFNEVMLRLLPVDVVVIDRGYRIVTVSGAARRLLGIRDMGIDQDFLHTVRGLPYARVREAIDRVFVERVATTIPELELETSAGGDGRYVLLTIVPMQSELGYPGLAVLSVTDITEQVQTRRRLEAVQSEQTQLVEELSAANKRLTDLNKELQDANEELQAANEELMLTQEELQASNEEFEATNEELQATNEELETNNEEVQATNEELEATNDELNARTQELTRLMRLLEAERDRIARMVSTAPFGVVVLRGLDLTVESFNERSAALFDVPDARGRPFEGVVRANIRRGLARACAEAVRRGEPLVVDASVLSEPSGDGDSVIGARVVPTFGASGDVDGLVIYLQPAADG